MPPPMTKAHAPRRLDFERHDVTKASPPGRENLGRVPESFGVETASHALVVFSEEGSYLRLIDI